MILWFLVQEKESDEDFSLVSESPFLKTLDKISPLPLPRIVATAPPEDGLADSWIRGSDQRSYPLSYEHAHSRWRTTADSLNQAKNQIMCEF